MPLMAWLKMEGTGKVHRNNDIVVHGIDQGMMYNPMNNLKNNTRNNRHHHTNIRQFLVTAYYDHHSKYFVKLPKRRHYLPVVYFALHQNSRYHQP